MLCYSDVIEAEYELDAQKSSSNASKNGRFVESAVEVRLHLAVDLLQQMISGWGASSLLSMPH